MIQIFRDAGYHVAGGFEDGVMRFEFPIDSTETSISVMLSREHRAEAASIQRFFNARSIAVIGASRRQDTIGQTLVRNLVLGDFRGRVYVVNPAAEAVSGMPAYASVSDIPDTVDVAIVAVPAEAVQDVVLDCAAKGVHGMIVISSGFAETGEEGRVRQRRLVGLARSYGLRLIGPNCLGIINTAADTSLNASLSTVMPPRGRAGFFCQSGALGVAILEKVARRGLGLSSFVSAGNRADVSGNDLLQYWEEDASTEVVLLYLESIGNPRKFSRVARRVSRRKPVIAVRSGRTTQGVPMGHAVRSIIAPQAAVDAMFRQAGVIQVDTLDEMFDVAQLVAHQPLPRGRRVAVIGNSDALGLLAADAAASVGLQVREPVALGGGHRRGLRGRARRRDRRPGGRLGGRGVHPAAEHHRRGGGQRPGRRGEQSDKPLVSLPRQRGRPGAAPGARRRRVHRRPGVGPVVPRGGGRRARPGPGGRLRRVAGRPEGEVVAPEEVDESRARRRVNRILMEHPEGRDLSFEDLRDVLDAYGITLWERIEVDPRTPPSPQEKLGWDVVLKARRAPAPAARPGARVAQHRHRGRDARRLVDDARHHRRAGDRGLHRAAGRPAGRAGRDRRLEDPLFGPVVSFGVSGAASELLGDRAYRIPPMHGGEAADMVREIKAAPLLFGYRGSEQVDVEAIEHLLLRVAQLKNDLPQISSLDLNLVLAGAHGATVLNAVGRVEPVADARSDWFVRRLSSRVGAPCTTDPGPRSAVERRTRSRPKYENGPGRVRMLRRRAAAAASRHESSGDGGAQGAGGARRCRPGRGADLRRAHRRRASPGPGLGQGLRGPRPSDAGGADLARPVAGTPGSSPSAAAPSTTPAA